MIICWCNNESCVEYAKEFELKGKIRYAFKEGELVPTNIPFCPVCAKQYFYRDEKNTEMPNVSIGEFKMMSNESKSKMLIKRYQEDNKKKDIKGVIARKRAQVAKKHFGL